MVKTVRKRKTTFYLTFHLIAIISTQENFKCKFCIMITKMKIFNNVK